MTIWNMIGTWKKEILYGRDYIILYITMKKNIYKYMSMYIVINDNDDDDDNDEGKKKENRRKTEG